MRGALAAASLAVLALWLWATADALANQRRVRRLAELPPLAAARCPSVSIVVAARDEERGIGPAASSLLALDYPRYEVIAVDDRSTDATGAILECLARRDERLRLLRVECLPPGWLGKNHALAAGAELARGEWLLFTDADVVFAPTTLSRAIGAADRGHLDHLTVAPALTGGGLWLDAFLSYFTLGFAFLVRPWRAADPRSGAYAGIGAFNLIRRRAYVALGGHDRIRLRPDDDMMLGKLVKRAGLRQELMLGDPLLRVAWYADLGEAVRGLEKNLFALLGYSFAATLGAVALSLVVGLAPFVAWAAVGGWPRWAFVAAACVSLFAYARAGRQAVALPAWQALLLPAMHLLWSYILVRSALLALRRGGIAWRGTLYRLDELRRNRV